MPSLPANPSQSVASLLQAMLLMLPRKWISVTITVGLSGDVVHIDNISAEADSAAGGRMPPLVAQQDALVEQSNVALTELGRLTGWAGPVARIVRADDASVRVTLFGAEEVEHSRIDVTAKAVLGLSWTDPLLDAMEDARARIAPAQAVFEATTKGFQRWDYDQDRAELSFTLASGEAWARPAQIVGSWSKGDGTWVWACDNPSVQKPCWERVAAVRDAARAEPGLGVLMQSPIPCSQAAAVQLAAVVSARMGASGMFGGTHAGGVLIVAVVG